MKEWIVSVVSVLLLVSLVAVLVPKGKLTPLINSLLSVIFLTSIFSPVLTGKVKFESNAFDVGGESYSIQSDYVNFIGSKAAEYKKSECAERLELAGIEPKELDVDYEIIDGELNFKKIILILDNRVINKNEAHINIIKEAKEIVSDIFRTDDITVNFYE